jgi:hypothetical protein
MCFNLSFLILRPVNDAAPEIVYSDHTRHHSDLIAMAGLPGSHGQEHYVRIEAKPTDGDWSKDVDQWEWKVDQSYAPGWYDDEVKAQAMKWLRRQVDRMTVREDRRVLLGGKYICIGKIAVERVANCHLIISKGANVTIAATVVEYLSCDIYSGGTLTAGDISGTLTAGYIANGGTLTAGYIYGTLTAGYIYGTLTAGYIANGGTLTAGYIANGGTLTAGNIANGGTLTAGHIYGTLTAGDISGTLTAGYISNGGTLTAGNIYGTLTAGYIANGGTLTAGHIYGTLTAGDISGTLTAGYIANGATISNSVKSYLDRNAALAARKAGAK